MTMGMAGLCIAWKKALHVLHVQTPVPYLLKQSPTPVCDAENESRIQAYLTSWEREMGHDKPSSSITSAPLDFGSQCDAMLAAEPAAISSIMGVYPESMVAEMKRRGILWFATATTVAEAVHAAQAGADVIVAQGMEAGGHRGAFQPAEAERSLVGLEPAALGSRY